MSMKSRAMRMEHIGGREKSPHKTKKDHPWQFKNATVNGRILGGVNRGKVKPEDLE